MLQFKVHKKVWQDANLPDDNSYRSQYLVKQEY